MSQELCLSNLHSIQSKADRPFSLLCKFQSEWNYQWSRWVNCHRKRGLNGSMPALPIRVCWGSHSVLQSLTHSSKWRAVAWRPSTTDFCPLIYIIVPRQQSKFLTNTVTHTHAHMHHAHMLPFPGEFKGTGRRKWDFFPHCWSTFTLRKIVFFPHHARWPMCHTNTYISPFQNPNVHTDNTKTPAIADVCPQTHQGMSLHTQKLWGLSLSWWLHLVFHPTKDSHTNNVPRCLNFICCHFPPFLHAKANTRREKTVDEENCRCGENTADKGMVVSSLQLIYMFCSI